MNRLQAALTLRILCALTAIGALGTIASCADAPIQRAAGVERLYVLFCGEGTAADRSRWSPGVDVGKPITLANSCYLIKHAKGWMLWETGFNESIATMKDGFPTPVLHWRWNAHKSLTGQLADLGLKPADISHLGFSHAHQDHIGGAEMIQKRYGPRVVMSGPDWDLVEKVPKRFTSMAPKRDVVGTDGMKITLGESTVTMWFTPGHTDGTLSFTFQVLDKGRPLNVVYSGGTALVYEYTDPAWGIKNMQTYINSQRHLAAKAKETGATVLLSNHSEFDEAVKKNRMLAGRGNGPHPYEIGADWVARYFAVTENCARATQLKLEQLQGQAR